MATVKKTYPVLGMTCASCAASVESMLNSQPGVASAEVNYANASVLVDFDPAVITPEVLRSTVQQIGYDLVVDEEENNADKIAERQHQAYLTLKRQTFGAALLTIPVVLIAMLWPTLPYAPYLELVLTLPVVFWFGRRFFSTAFKQLRHGKANMDTLVALSTGVAFFFSAFNTFYPQFWLARGLQAHVYFEAAAAIITFILLGKLLEEKAKSNTSSAIKKLIGLQPKTVIRINPDGSEQEIPVSLVQPGDQLVVKPGDKVPVDGTVVQGHSYVEESTITGEPLPAEKTTGSTVYAGTLNQQGTFVLQAEKVGGDTLLAQIIKTVREAQGSKAPVQSLVDKVAAVFVPTVIGIALLTFVVWLLVGGEQAFTHALLTAITVLVIACPCALGLATPTAIMVGIGKGAENHILIKDAESLEKLRDIDAIILDKTGTLTEGKPQVTDIIWQPQVDKAQAARILVAIEKRSEHPLAAAVTAYLEPDNNLPNLENFSNLAGRGIRAEVNDQRYLVGNQRLLEEEEHVTLSAEVLQTSRQAEEAGQTVFYFASQQELLAVIIIADRLKDTAHQAIATLREHGITPYLLTGDNQRAARAIAAEAGIEHYYGGQLPADKAAFVEKLQQKGQLVAMVGDGINDSQALAKADVSIAMSRGADIALDVAKVIVMSTDLTLLPKAVALSQQTVTTIRQNLFWAFIYNIIGIPIAAGVLYPLYGFLLNPMIAAAAMAFSSVSVVSNSLRLKWQPLKLKKRPAPSGSKPATNNIKPITMKQLKYKTNINCNGCIAAVTPSLDATEGIVKWSVDTDNPDKILTVEVDGIDPAKVEEAVKKAGYNIEPISEV